MNWKQSAIKWQSLANRITGISAFGFGMSWKAPGSDREIVRKVITYLEDRRVLFQDYNLGIALQVSGSLADVRKELTSALVEVAEGSPAAGAFRIMRAACRDFKSVPEPDFSRPGANRSELEDAYIAALAKLRTTFGQQLTVLAYLYQIDIEKGLASILPPEPKNSD